MCIRDRYIISNNADRRGPDPGQHHHLEFTAGDCGDPMQETINQNVTRIQIDMHMYAITIACGKFIALLLLVRDDDTVIRVRTSTGKTRFPYRFLLSE